MIIYTKNHNIVSCQPEVYNDNDVKVLDTFLCAHGIRVCDLTIDESALTKHLNESLLSFDAFVDSLSNLPLMEQKQLLIQKTMDAYSMLNAHFMGMDSSEYQSMHEYCQSLGLKGWKSFDDIAMLVQGYEWPECNVLVTDERFDDKFNDLFIQHFRECAQMALAIR